MKKVNPTIFGIVAAVVAVLIGLALLNPFYIVNPGERALTIRLGKLQNNVAGEGLQFRIPLIDQVEKLSIRKKFRQFQASSYSKDLQTVTVLMTIEYALPENKLLKLYREYRGDPFEGVIKPQIEEAIKTITAQYSAENFVKSRTDVRTNVVELLKDRISEVTLHRIVIENIDLTEELEKAIEEKQVMEQTAKKKDYELQAAQKQAKIQITKAQAEAQSIKLKAEALKQNKNLVELKKIETYEKALDVMERKWNGQFPQVVTTSSGLILDVPTK